MIKNASSIRKQRLRALNACIGGFTGLATLGIGFLISSEPLILAGIAVLLIAQIILWHAERELKKLGTD